MILSKFSYIYQIKFRNISYTELQTIREAGEIMFNGFSRKDIYEAFRNAVGIGLLTYIFALGIFLVV